MSMILFCSRIRLLFVSWMSLVVGHAVFKERSEIRDVEGCAILANLSVGCAHGRQAVDASLGTQGNLFTVATPVFM
eukprot:8141188-Heterocapsa_arctica.AAC.1